MRYTILLSMGCLMLSALGAERPVVLAQRGQTDFHIVVADDATEAEKHAAEELSSHLIHATILAQGRRAHNVLIVASLPGERYG